MERADRAGAPGDDVLFVRGDRGAAARVGWAAAGQAWLLAGLLPMFAAWAAVARPIEEHASDAAYFHVYRGVVFSAARADGWGYPRWAEALNSGLGSPLFTFYPPLTYYVMDALHGVGVAHPLAWRLLAATALVLAGLGAFGLGMAVFRRADAGLVGAAVFVYAPHLLREWFDRGSPEGLAIALSPWVLWALLRLASRPSGLRLALAAGSWALVILAHSLAALLLLPVLGVFVAYLGLRGGARAARVTAAGLLAGGLLAGFYVAPFVAEAGSVRLERASAAESARPAANPVPLEELLAPVSVLDAGLDNNALGQSLGPPGVLVVVGGVVALAGWRGRRRAEAGLVLLLVAFGLGMVWLQTEWATALWAARPELSILQFRWRLLSYLGLAAALIGGYLVWRSPPRAAGWVAAVLVGLAVAPQLPMLHPELLRRRAELAEAPTLADVRAWTALAGVPGLTAFDELRPRWRDKELGGDEARRVAAGPVANLPRGARVTSEGRGAGRWEVGLETPVAFEAALHQLYFPGWAGAVDDEPAAIGPVDGTGYVRMRVPAGAHTVSLRYEGTWAERVGLLVSGACLGLLGVAAVAWRGRGPVGTGGGIAYPRPRWWLAAALVLAVVGKGAWVDPRTTLLRRDSSCGAIDDRVVQVDVRFGGAVRLCGYRFEDGEVRPGGEAGLTLYWEAGRVGDEPTDSFVHLVGPAVNPARGDRVWGGQEKGAPGGYPFREWRPGGLYQDRYVLAVAPDAPPGEYQLEIGWWRPGEDRRLRPAIREAGSGRLSTGREALLVDGIAVGAGPRAAAYAGRDDGVAARREPAE